MMMAELKADSADSEMKDSYFERLRPSEENKVAKRREIGIDELCQLFRR